MKPSNSMRLWFCKMHPSDVDELFIGAFGSERVTRFLQWDCHNDVDQTRSLVDEMCQTHNRGEKYFWIARSLADNSLIGLGSLKPDDITIWIGFLIASQQHRKGYGFEMLEALEDAAFRYSTSISAAVAPTNRASVSLIEKAGWNADDRRLSDGLLVFRKLAANKRLDAKA